MTPPIDKETLEPCPFCASANLDIKAMGKELYWVFCNDCECEGPVYEPQGIAVNAWNNRACTTQLADRDALIVRQGEMLERAEEALNSIRIRTMTWPYCLTLENQREAAKTEITAVYRMAAKALAALQPSAAKDAGDGEIG